MSHSVKKIVQHSALAVLASTFLVGCNDSPEQYSNPANDLVQNRADQKVEPRPGDQIYPVPKPNIGDGSDTGDDTKANDDRVRANSQKPIIYGGGAAGIDFTMTMTEGLKILTKPDRTIPNGGTIVTVNEEGIVVYWRSQEPQIPVLMWLDRNYAGALEIGGDFEPLKVTSNLSKYYTEADPQGKEMLANMYRTLEGLSADYDCFATKDCDIKVFGTDYFLYITPKLIFMVSQDRKIVADIRLPRVSGDGILANPFDFADGSFYQLVESTEDDSKSFNLGDSIVSMKEKTTWQEFEETTRGTNYIPGTGTNYNSIQFGSIYAYFDKGEFGREDRKPKLDDRLKGLIVSGDFSSPIVFDKNFVSFEKDDNGNFVFAKKESADEKENLLKLSSLIEKEDAQAFFTSFYKFAKDSFELTNPDKIVLASKSGLNSKDPEISYSSSIRVISKDDYSVDLFEMSFAKPTASFGYMAKIHVPSSSINKAVFTALTNDIVIDGLNPVRELGGFKIGETLQLSEIDFGREEATMKLNRENTLYVARVDYEAEMLQKAIYRDDGKEISTKVGKVSIPDLGITLGVVPAEVEGKNLMKIVAITAFPKGEIRNLCGVDQIMLPFAGKISLSFKLEQKDSDVWSKVQALNGKCTFYRKNMNSGANRIEELFFTENRLAMGFSDRELSSVSIYELPEAVAAIVPENSPLDVDTTEVAQRNESNEISLSWNKFYQDMLDLYDNYTNTQILKSFLKGNSHE